MDEGRPRGKGVSGLGGVKSDRACQYYIRGRWAKNGKMAPKIKINASDNLACGACIGIASRTFEIPNWI